MLSTIRKPALIKIYIMPLLSMISGSMNGAIMILYALNLGANVFQVNLITTIQSTMAILLMVPFGILSDRFGRKPMVIYPRIITIMGTVIRVFATDPNHLILSSFVGGFAGGAFFPVLLSMIGDITKPNERQEAISTMFFFSSIGMVLGPVIATTLLTFPQIYLRNIYQIIMVIEIGELVYLVTQTKETGLQSPKDKRISFRASISGLINQTEFQGLIIMTFLYFFSRSIIDTYIPIYALVDLKLSNVEVASFSVYRSLAVMLIRFSSATVLTKISTRPFLIVVLALNVITGMVSAAANDYLLLVVVQILSGLSFGAVRILSTTLAANSSTPENRGVANSFIDLCASAGNFTKIVTTPIVNELGFASVFMLGGVIGLGSILPPVIGKVKN